MIANNVIANAPNGWGIQIYPSSSNVIVSENTIVGAMRDGIIVGGQGTKTTINAVIVNNIIAFNGGYGIGTYWGGGSAGSGNIAANNLVWGNSAGGLTGSGISYQSNTSADPLFADRSARNFHLQSGSPAIDRAQADYAVGTDFDHVARPQGAGPDQGAFEH